MVTSHDYGLDPNDSRVKVLPILTSLIVIETLYKDLSLLPGLVEAKCGWTLVGDPEQLAHDNIKRETC